MSADQQKGPGKPSQLSLGFPATEPKLTALLVTEANESAVAVLQAPQSWPFHTICLLGPPRSGLSALARGDLTARVTEPFPADYEQLRQDLNNTADTLSSTVSQVIGVAGSIGNGAAEQRQHDVLGQVMLTLERLRDIGLADTLDAWHLQRALLDELATHWEQPDHGLWEMRGEPQRFTHSRAMMWAAFDCGVRAVESGCDGDPTRWIELRDLLRDEVLTLGFDTATGSFRQHYDTSEVDASLLQLPTIGIVDARDPRFLGTIARIEQELLVDGLPLRYRTTGVDGLAGDEHPFVLCAFWLVIAYAQCGRLDDARALMERLIALRNDVGLLAEEIDPATGHHWGNFPQAFSHLGLVLAAAEIAKAERRAG